MDTAVASTSTPAASAAPAAASASSASSAVSSTPATPAVATPAASPAAASPAASAPAAAAAPAAAQAPETSEQIRQRMHEKLLSSAEALAKGEQIAKPEIEEQQQVEQPQVAEEVAAQVEEAQPEGEAVAEESVEDEPFALEATGPLAPKELQGKLQEIPELSAVLDKHPELKNQLFAASRLAQRAAQYDSVVGSPEEAQAAMSASAQYADLSNRFTSIQDDTSYQGFMDGLIAQTTIYDDDGNPLKDAQGRIVTDGSTGRLVKHAFSTALNYWESVGNSSEDAELQAAVEVLKARAFGGPASAQGGLTDEQQQAQETLRQERQALDTERRTHLDAQRKDFDSKVESRIDSTVKKTIEARTKEAQLDDSDRAELTRRIEEKLYTAIHNNPQYQIELDPLWRRQGFGTKKADDRVALANKWVNLLLPKIAREELVAMGAKLQQRTQDAKSKATARAAASRSEPATAMTHARPAQMTREGLHAQIRADYAKSHNGEHPDATTMISLLRQYRQAS